MSKIPNFLNPPGDAESLTDRALYEWSVLGQHASEVHAWACGGPEDPEGLTERVQYLLDVTERGDLHPEVARWRSVALMTVNCILGGSVPRSVCLDLPRVAPLSDDEPLQQAGADPALLRVAGAHGVDQ